jgi:uncharacterized membrane protein
LSSPATGPTNLGVPPNVGGLLCYAPCCIGLLFSIAAVIIEKQSRFLRFHAFQSLLFQGVMIVLGFGVGIVITALSHVMPCLGGVLGLIINVVLFLGMLGATIFLMIKAYNGEEFEIPTLGQMARNWV